MQSTMFVAELEALHMSTKLSAFQSCNKEGLVRTLWRNHSQEPRVSSTMKCCFFYTKCCFEEKITGKVEREACRLTYIGVNYVCVCEGVGKKGSFNTVHEITFTQTCSIPLRF